MVMLALFTRGTVLPFRHEFPDDCEIVVKRCTTGTIHVTSTGTSFELFVPSPALSERHAHVRIRQGQVTIEDLGSRNGTLVRLAPQQEYAINVHAVALGSELTLRVENSAFADTSKEFTRCLRGYVWDVGWWCRLVW